MRKEASVQASDNFLRLLEGKSSLFVLGKSAHCTEPQAHVVRRFGAALDLPVICMHWNKVPNDTSIDMRTGHINLLVSRNFTNTLIKLGKLLADKQHVILILDFDDMALDADKKPLFRFVSVLLEKCQKMHSTVLVASTQLTHEDSLSSLFDSVFRIEDDTLQKIGEDGRTESSYNLSGEELDITRPAETDMEKIKEIFRLTPEEREELDMIASRHLRDLNITRD